MKSQRIAFLELFAQSTPLLKLIFLNHSGEPAKLLNDISTIDMLADENSTLDFINYCTSHKHVNTISIIPQYRKTEITIEFKDRSELKFYLLKSMIRKALACLPIDDIRKESYVNEFNMLVSAPHHHYEYVFLSCQFAGMPFAERYKTYFSAFDFENRTKIFRYIQPRYDLVINNLEELYTPKASTLLKIMVGLRKDKRNSLFRMFLRVIEYGFFNLAGIMTKKVVQVFPSSGDSTETAGSRKNNTAGQAVL